MEGCLVKQDVSMEGYLHANQPPVKFDMHLVSEKFKPNEVATDDEAPLRVSTCTSLCGIQPTDMLRWLKVEKSLFSYKLTLQYGELTFSSVAIGDFKSLKDTLTSKDFLNDLNHQLGFEVIRVTVDKQQTITPQEYRKWKGLSKDPNITKKDIPPNAERCGHCVLELSPRNVETRKRGGGKEDDDRLLQAQLDNIRADTASKWALAFKYGVEGVAAAATLWSALPQIWEVIQPYCVQLTDYFFSSLILHVHSPDEKGSKNFLCAVCDGELEKRINEKLASENISVDVRLLHYETECLDEAKWKESKKKCDEIVRSIRKWKPVITTQKEELVGDTSVSSIAETKLPKNVSVPNIRDVFIDLGKPTPLPNKASMLEKRYDSLDAELRDVPFLVDYYCSLSKGTRKEKIYAKLSDIVRCEVQASTDEIRQLAKQASGEKSYLLKQIAEDCEKKQHV